MTKLFHIKRDHLVTFYISLEKKREYCDISATVWPISKIFGSLMQIKCGLLKISFSSILKIEKSR